MIAAIIQARMSSTRLPGKVMADVHGQPLLQRVVDRAARASVDVVAVATSKAPADDVIAGYCAGAGVACHRGSEDDVLDRYYRTAAALDASVIVRITADCPLLDPSVVDAVIRAFEGGRYDYASNTLKPTYPDGLDAEVFTRDALNRAWTEARLSSEREHVTPYIWKSPDKFRIRSVEGERDWSRLRWTVDEPADLELVRHIYADIGADIFGMGDVLRLIEQHPALKTLNAGIERNEGYARSLANDQVTK